MQRQGWRRNGTRRRMLCALLLAIEWQSATRVWATPLTRDELDSLLGSRAEFSRAEVAELMANILSDADEEIERTAQEAAREVAAQDAGGIAFQKSLVEDLKIEAARNEGEKRVWRTCTGLEAVAIIAEMVVYGLTR